MNKVNKSPCYYRITSQYNMLTLTEYSALWVLCALSTLHSEYSVLWLLFTLHSEYYADWVLCTVSTLCYDYSVLWVSCTLLSTLLFWKEKSSINCIGYILLIHKFILRRIKCSVKQGGNVFKGWRRIVHGGVQQKQGRGGLVYLMCFYSRHYRSLYR